MHGDCQCLMTERLANIATHAFGLAVCLAGIVPLCQRAGLKWTCVVYLFSLIGVYLFSTASHWATDDKLRNTLRQLDQGFIFLLVVATFTPFVISFLSGWYTVLIACMWGLALYGFAAKVFFNHEQVMVWPHIVLGWVPLICVPALLSHVSPSALVLAVVGGCFYTIGTYFLINDDIPYYHAVWHILVMCGSVTHYLAILLFAYP